MESNAGKDSERKILAPRTWLLYSTALFSLILVPIVTGAFYMLKISVRLFSAKPEYSVIAGILIGILLSFVAGFFYSNNARKHADE